MIPKIIHYCWFGGNPLPESAKKCIASWRKFLPGYEIKEWNESNFDVRQCAYVAESYKAKNWAYVSDYARIWILYKYGGLYFDTDVEVIKPIDDIIARGNFMGEESNLSAKDEKSLKIAPGLGLGVNPGLGLFKEILESYQKDHVYTWSGKITMSIVNRTTKFLKTYRPQRLSNGIFEIANIYIYPPEYFCPKDYETGKMNITPNTRSIHHYTATWTFRTINIWEKIKKRLEFVSYRFYGSFIWRSEQIFSLKNE